MAESSMPLQADIVVVGAGGCGLTAALAAANDGADVLVLERDRHVVLEFESYALAKACYESPEYKEAEKIRIEASDGYVVVIEGYDG